MAKINKKVTKGAETDVKLAKVNAKSVTIQKADKKPIKNLVNPSYFYLPHTRTVCYAGLHFLSPSIKINI